MQFLSSNKYTGFSKAAVNGATTINHSKQSDTRTANESFSDCDESWKEQNDVEPKSVISKDKPRRKNRRKYRKGNKQKSIKIIGINAAGLSTKIESFENLLDSENPSIFIIQETKFTRKNQLNIAAAKKFDMYPLLRKNSGGGGLLIGALKDLHSNWISEGDDSVEYIVIEVWIEGFPVRILNGYGPQEYDDSEKTR